LVIAYNPNRPKGRLRFSIAHEVAHALFPGVAEVVRHRTPVGALPDVSESDEYELELLCNIVAGELLLPTEAVAGLLEIDTDIDFIMETRRRWDVSTERSLSPLPPGSPPATQHPSRSTMSWARPAPAPPRPLRLARGRHCGAASGWTPRAR
jgi:hypothetical protein